VGLRAGLDTEASAGNRTPVVQFVVRHNTDSATPDSPQKTVKRYPLRTNGRFILVTSNIFLIAASITLHLYAVYLTTLLVDRSIGYNALNDGMINELEMAWKDAVVAYSRASSRHFRERIKQEVLERTNSTTFLTLLNKLNGLQSMTQHTITKWFSVCSNITSTFRTIATFIGFVTQNNDK
jgi:hypothetical protein